ncbi:hypothetical protein F5148DRAFT_1323925 [Russula earlei]|uniref:Uncharacterized protein n=1 Tax=Russula earlei TaxID=71964 RepID=A0ACC0U1G0_9AGAM|nr:hypothetical protein F5148DRAFT_1323925 [Russula earlei]
MAQQGDWHPFDSEVQFNLADLLYRRAELSNSNIDALLDLWARSMGNPAPFRSFKEMHAMIDSSELGDIPWECLRARFSGDVSVGESIPDWMQTDYEIWYRNPDAVVSTMLNSAAFAGQFDLRPYIDLDADGRRRWSNVMSGNMAWRQCDVIMKANPNALGAMYCPIILGSDKTTYDAHRGAVIPIAFLAIPHSDRRSDDSTAFRTFKRQLYHSSIAAVLRPLCQGMHEPVVRRCPDGHFRRVIYDLVAFIADYPEQVMLTGLVQGWCPKSLPGSLDVYTGPRTARLVEGLTGLLDSKTLWKEYGIDDDVIPFTSDFPRADIHQMLSPDLLHQVIKGTFKDHLVEWVCNYLLAKNGERKANAILDDIDRRIAAVPPFPGLRRFPQGRRFKQWTGDDSKALMKVYVPAIIGYVPDEVIKCLSAFLDACYIARRQDIYSDTLDAFDAALHNFRELREVFRIPGVRPTGFSLPRQHAFFHYRRLIEDFGAPGGLCSSITESRHITAVKKPWRRSNKYNALGQMLLINQRLDKLAAMRSEFTARGMLPGGTGHSSDSTLAASVLGNSRQISDDEDDDCSPVQGQATLGRVKLAQTRGTSY